MDVMKGFGEFNKKVTNALTGGAPERSYMGGSAGALEQQRTTLGGYGAGGMDTGGQYAGQGAGMLNQAGQYAAADRDTGMGLYNQGMGMGGQATQQQNAYIHAMTGAANANAASPAEMQMRAANEQNTRMMLGQAAAARGGNQAAAIRNAQAFGSQNMLQTNQQAGILRAQEEQARINRIVGANQAAAGMYGQQAGMGYGLAGQGLGATMQSTGQYGQLGGQLGQLGTAQQNTGLGAYGLLNDLNKSQLDADRGNSSAASVAGNSTAAFGNLISGVSSMWGGGGNKAQQQA